MARVRFPALLLVLTLDSSWTNTTGIGSAQSAPHHFYPVDHSADNTIEQRLVCHSFSRLSHSCHTLSPMALVCTTSPEQHKSRWSWPPPLHRFQTSHIHCLDALVVTTSSEQHKSWPTPSRFESGRLHDLDHLTLRFSSPHGCARFTVRIRRPRVCLHWLLHKTLHFSNQTHSHQVHQFPYLVARQPLRSDVSNV